MGGSDAGRGVDFLGVAVPFSVRVELTRDFCFEALTPGTCDAFTGFAGVGRSAVPVWTVAAGIAGVKLVEADVVPLTCGDLAFSFTFGLGFVVDFISSCIGSVSSTGRSIGKSSRASE